MQRETEAIRRKKSNFLVQGSILALAGILVRIIGLLYRIPLTRIVGEEGMGYYAQAFNIYSVVLLLSSYSLPLAVSKMVSARMGKRQYKNAARIFRAALIYATVVGFIGCAAVWFFADALAEALFKMPLAAFALKALAPTIWVMAYLGVFRGYYQGYSTMLPTAMSQIIEQVINAFVSVGAAYYLSEMAIREAKTLSGVRSYGAAGGTIGTGAGALAALLFLFILYLFGIKYRRMLEKEDRSGKRESYRRITGILFYTVLPVILSTAIYNINGIIDGAIFGHSMAFLSASAEAAKEYGIYTGKYMVLINVPVAIANSLSSSLIPELSKAGVAGDRVKISRSIALAIRFAMLISIPSAVGLAILAKPIITLFFGESLKAVALMQAGSFAVVLYSLSTVSNAILQGTNHMSVPVKNAAAALLIHVAALLLFLLGFRLGGYGLVFANMLFALLICIFNARAIRRRLYYRQELWKTYVLPLICALGMALPVWLLYAGLEAFTAKWPMAAGQHVRDFILFLLPALLGLVSYPILLIKTRAISRSELLLMPKGKKIVSLLSKLRLM